MSRFSDYESSHITPQMTLLKKFNEVLKYLRDYEPEIISTKIYKHKITLEYGVVFIIHSSKSTAYEDENQIYDDLEHIIEDLKKGIIVGIDTSGLTLIKILKRSNNTITFDEGEYRYNGSLVGGDLSLVSDEIVGEL